MGDKLSIDTTAPIVSYNPNVVFNVPSSENSSIVLHKRTTGLKKTA
jgi:hypothetical protein